MTPPHWMAKGALLTAAMLAISGSAVNAAPSTPPSPKQQILGPDKRDRSITLITGDKVVVSRTANGGYQTRIDIAPRPDGRSVVTQTLVDKDHLYVLPSDAAALVAAGKLDRRLFDVRTLLSDGYGDAVTGALPVIVAFGRDSRASDLSARARALLSSDKVRPLRGVNGAAASVTKKSAAAFWSTLAPSAGSRTLGGGLSNVWLDAKVKAALDSSVPLIGGPQAWAAGLDGTGVKVAVLDTGIDSNHPDFAGKNISGRSFVTGVPSPLDGHGHGTHVASTILGSGAASAGKYKGVAPGAQLSVGKVLNDGGSGESSWIIEGMEWAAITEDADVINMSLGSNGPSDGTDPMSVAVNELSASTGALFVISAGNSGPGERTIGAPGAATSALTVAAFDKSDQLAGFSSRGPVMTNYELKPDIAAPGVTIAAARAAGTSLGGDVDNPQYTTASGTSMAAPHIAGAAAILAQQHPDWTAQQIKAALTSTSKDGGFTSYQQGAGRVDVAAATKATVVAVTSGADFGRLRYPQTGPPVTRTVAYRNTGTQPVTLNLSAQLSASPAGMLSVSPATLEIAAGTSAEATVTLDPAMGEPGSYSGVVLATASGVSLRVPVGAFKEPQGFELSTRVTAPANATEVVYGFVVVRRTDVDTNEWIILDPGMGFHLHQGVYSVSTMVMWADSPGGINHAALLSDPQVTLDKDVSVPLDAGKARRIEFDAGRQLDPYGATSNIWQIPAGSNAPFGLVAPIPYGVQSWALPTRKVTVGKFYFDHAHVVGSPMITASVGSLTLHPRYQHYSATVAKLDGRKQLSIVDVGTGTAADFARVDVRGKVALIGVGSERFAAEGPIREVIERAVQRGAAAVFGYSDTGRPDMLVGFPGIPSSYPLPMAGIPAQEGKALRERLRHGQATIHIDSQPSINDLYSLAYVDEGAVPDSLRYVLRDDQLMTIRHESHGESPVAQSQLWGTRRPDILQLDGFNESFRVVQLQDLAGPVTRTERVGPVSAKTLWYRQVSMNDLASVLKEINHRPDNEIQLMSRVDVFDRPGRREETWNQSPTVPGSPVISPAAAALVGEMGGGCTACRFTGLLPDGDMLPLFTMTTDGDGNFGELTTYSNFPWNPEHLGSDVWHLYSGDQELPQHSLLGTPGIMPYYSLPKGSGSYRLTQRFENWKPAKGYGTKTDTTWTFRTAEPTAKEVPLGYDSLGMCVDRCRVEPLMFLRYGFNLDSGNRLAAPGLHVFTITAYHQASLGKMPSIAGMKLSVSFDGGAQWRQVPVVPLGNGTFGVLLIHPPSAGTVSLRTEAWDSAGNRIEQTVPDAYGIR